MIQVFPASSRLKLAVPGRDSWDIVSSRTDAHQATLRYVEIPPAWAAAARQPHRHLGVEEVMWVLAGEGIIEGPDIHLPVSEGCAVYVPADVPHMTRNTGQSTLRLLCFFPESSIGSHTEEPAR